MELGLGLGHGLRICVGVKVTIGLQLGLGCEVGIRLRIAFGTLHLRAALRTLVIIFVHASNSSATACNIIAIRVHLGQGQPVGGLGGYV